MFGYKLFAKYVNLEYILPVMAFLFTLISLDEWKFFIFYDVQLVNFFYFMVSVCVCVCHVFKKSLPTSKVMKIFLFKKLYSFSFKLKSMIHLKLIFAHGVK